MDTRQYGPALFPTLKQVRHLLDEARGHSRRDGSAERVAEGFDDPGGAGPESK